MAYDMGNAGDLLKHGVLAEFMRWRFEQRKPVRFLDLFAGEPSACANTETIRRVESLTESALSEGQTEIGDGRYLGSSRLARKLGACVFVNDRCPERLEKLRACGFPPLCEAFPNIGTCDAYAAFEKIACEAKEDDIALLDPFSKFLPCKATEVVPQMGKMAKRAAVILFALNWDPGNRVGLRFNDLLKDHLPGAWRMTCPPLPYRGIRGESQYHAEIVLAAPDLREVCSKTGELKARLEDFAWKLAKALRMFMPQVVGEPKP